MRVCPVLDRYLLAPFLPCGHIDDSIDVLAVALRLTLLHALLRSSPSWGPHSARYSLKWDGMAAIHDRGLCWCADRWCAVARCLAPIFHSTTFVLACVAHPHPVPRPPPPHHYRSLWRAHHAGAGADSEIELLLASHCCCDSAKSRPSASWQRWSPWPTRHPSGTSTDRPLMERLNLEALRSHGTPAARNTYIFGGEGIWRSHFNLQHNKNRRPRGTQLLTVATFIVHPQNHEQPFAVREQRRVGVLQLHPGWE